MLIVFVFFYVLCMLHVVSAASDFFEVRLTTAGLRR